MATETHIRCFIGVLFEPTSLNTIQDKLLLLKMQFKHNSFRWIPLNQIHLTLRFLGTTPVALLPELQHHLNQAAQQCNAFSLKLTELNYFPKHQPHVLAIMTEPCEVLITLVNKIEKKAISLGLDPEKRAFHSHITIARLKGEKFPPFKAPFYIREIIPVKEFSLIQSSPSHQGSHYSVLNTFTLT